MSIYRHAATATEHTITGRRQYFAALSLGLAGNETEADLAALGFAPYTPPPPDPQPTEAESLASAYPELPGTVRAAFAALQSLVSMGVNLDLSAGLPGWQHIGQAIAARRREIETLADYAALDAAADEADGLWRAVVYWCGSDATAYRLAPELAAIGV